MIYSAVTEQALLCCMLMDVETARNAAGMLVEDDFYLSQNRDVFRAIAALVEKNMVPDLPMISAELNRQGTAERVGMDTLSQIATAEGTTINANKYIADLQEMGWMRRCGAKGQALTEAANKGNAEAIYSLLDELKGDNVKGDVPQNAAEIMAGYVQELDASRKNGNKLNGLSSGFVDVDMYLGGLCKGDLLILAARPSMGKTALAGDFLRNVARKLPENAVCVFFRWKWTKNALFPVCTAVTRVQITWSFPSMAETTWNGLIFWKICPKRAADLRKWRKKSSSMTDRGWRLRKCGRCCMD